jgi:hypothetical protein
MREFIKIVEDGLTVEPAQSQWREQMLAYAREADSEFTTLHPQETGLPVTLYASEVATHPTLIVDSTPGKRFRPSEGSKAYRIGEKTGDPLIDRWIAQNVAVLRAYSAGEIDTVAFHHRMQPVRDRLDEMPNYDRGRYNTPLAFFIRPEGSGASHAARVKVNANYNRHYDNQSNFSIAFFPTTGIARGHNIGQAKQSDVDGMIHWFETHRAIFIGFYIGQITAQQFETYLAAHPYP